LPSGILQYFSSSLGLAAYDTASCMLFQTWINFIHVCFIITQLLDGIA